MSLPDWEIEDEWEKRVCEPVMKYRLAPREALMILEQVGRMASRYGNGIIAEILTKLNEVESAYSNPNQ